MRVTKLTGKTHMREAFDPFVAMQFRVKTHMREDCAVQNHRVLSVTHLKKYQKRVGFFFNHMRDQRETTVVRLIVSGDNTEVSESYLFQCIGARKHKTR